MCLTASWAIASGSVGQIAKYPGTLDDLDEKVIESNALLGWSGYSSKISSGRKQGARGAGE
jgi:hypothetical protein